MPLFEYGCPKCGQKEEILVRTADTAEAPSCSVCGVLMEKAWAPVAECRSSRSNSCAPGGGFS